MFNFFSDVKNRLTAIEAQIEAIYTHLRGNVVGGAEIVSAPPATSETPATTPTNTGEAN